MIGYPDKWKTYDFDVERDDFAGNALRAARVRDASASSRRSASRSIATSGR